jgi:hypothetical protein
MLCPSISYDTTGTIFIYIYIHTYYTHIHDEFDLDLHFDYAFYPHMCCWYNYLPKLHSLFTYCFLSKMQFKDTVLNTMISI